MNKFKEINWNPDTKAIQAFARVLTIGIPSTGLAWFVIMWFIKDVWIVKVPVYIISIGWSIALVSCCAFSDWYLFLQIMVFSDLYY